MVPISMTMSYGDEGVVLTESGSLQLRARCVATTVTDFLTDQVLDLFWTSTDGGWFSSTTGSTPQMAGASVQLASISQANSAPRYGQGVDGAHAMSPDGSYLAVPLDTTALGLNVFGQDCVVAGMAVAMPGYLATTD